MTTKTRKTPVTRIGKPRPARIENAQDRGLAFRYFLADLGIGVKDFAEAAGIATSTLGRYFSGDIDVAGVDQAMAEKILTGMGITDTHAWELLAIPEEHRKTFRSFRPPPLGFGPDVYRVANETLPDGLSGEVTLPSQTSIELEPENLDEGIQIIQLDDGRFHAVTVQMMPASVERRLGRLVAAYFSARSA